MRTRTIKRPDGEVVKRVMTQQELDHYNSLGSEAERVAFVTWLKMVRVPVRDEVQ